MKHSIHAPGSRAKLAAVLRRRWALAKAAGRNQLQVPLYKRGVRGEQGRPLGQVCGIRMQPEHWAIVDRLAAPFPWWGNRSAYLRDIMTRLGNGQTVVGKREAQPVKKRNGKHE